MLLLKCKFNNNEMILLRFEEWLSSSCILNIIQKEIKKDSILSYFKPSNKKLAIESMLNTKDYWFLYGSIGNNDMYFSLSYDK